MIPREDKGCEDCNINAYLSIDQNLIKQPENTYLTLDQEKIRHLRNAENYLNGEYVMSGRVMLGDAPWINIWRESTKYDKNCNLCQFGSNGANI